MQKSKANSPRKHQKEEKSSLVGTRLTTPKSETNKGKLNKIEPLFGQVCILKNLMSQQIKQDIEYLHAYPKEAIGGYKRFSNHPDLTAWESQALYQDIFGHYLENINRSFAKHQIKVQGRFTPLANKVNSLITANEEQLADDRLSSFLMKWQDKKEYRTTPIDVNYKTLAERMLALIVGRRARLLNDIKAPIYSSGTHRRNPSAKGCKLLCDDSNSKYKWFFEVRVGKDDKAEVVNVPVLYNKTRFRPEEMRKDSIYSLKCRDGKLQFCMTAEREAPVFLERDKTLGIDVNTSRNLLAGSDGTFAFADLVWLSHLNKKINTLGNPQYYNNKHKSILEKLLLKNEGRLKTLIAKYLEDQIAKGVTDIVLEDISFANDATLIKGLEGIKQSRLNRLLRLSAIRKWLEPMAEKRGVKLHLTHPGYTSQVCTECHHVSKFEQKKHKIFFCQSCGHTADADTNSAITIEQRLLLDVLRTGLHTFDC